MNAATGVPPRPLVVLTLAVLALHGLGMRWALDPKPPVLQPAALQVRAIEPAAGPAPQPVPSPVLAPVREGTPAVAMPVTTARAHRPAGAGLRPSAAPAAAPGPTPAPAAHVDSADPADGAATKALPPEALSAPVPPEPPIPIALPAPARWHYAVTGRRRGLAIAGGIAELDWRHDGRSYQATLQVTAAPLPARTQRSDGDLGPDGLAPRRFSDRLRGEQATHFDRARGRIVFSSNRPDAPLPAGAQDRLSVLLQLAALVAADPGRFVPGAVVALPTATTREAGTWPFRVEGTEDLLLPAGRFTALKLVRPPRHEYDVRLEVWLVPGRDYGPVRLRLTAPHGDWLDLQGSGTDKG